MITIKNHLLCFLLVTTISYTHAQTLSSIVGQVKSNDGKPISFAAVQLLFASDSSLAKAAFTDDQGAYLFQGIKSGAYHLHINLIGYSSHFSSKVELKEQNNVLKLPDIILTPSSINLNAIDITHKKPFLERKLDRMVMNVESSISSAGNTALELIEKAPGVLVNQDIAIQILGKQGVVVMIDGRPTNLSGADLTSYLKSISGSTISRIEIITQPSSKYDAEGNAGIIDIRLKKDKNEGFNGSVNVNLGQGVYFKPSGGINANYRNKKWNLYGNYNYSEPNNFTNFYINRQFFDSAHQVLSIFDQTSFAKQPLRNHNAKIGLDFYLNAKTIIGILANTILSSSDREGYTNSTITDAYNKLLYTTHTANTYDDQKQNNLLNVNFKHEFNQKGQELTIDLDYGNYSNSSNQNFENRFFNPDQVLFDSYALNANQAGDIYVHSAKADYTQFFGAYKFEMGGKSTLVKTKNDIVFYNVVNNQNEYDSTRSSKFNYEENINAAYAIIGNEWKGLEYQFGLRLENTNSQGNQINSEDYFDRQLTHLFPSLSCIYKKIKNQSIALSYSRRIDRPTFRQLHPFRVFVDPYTYVVGDPSLLPSLTHSFDLTHTFKDKIITSFNYSKTNNEITDVFSQDDSTKISYQIPANIAHVNAYSLTLSFPIKYKKWLQSNFDATVFYNDYQGPLGSANLRNNSLSWYARFQNNVPIGTKGWATELSYYYQSQMAWGQFIIRDLGQLSFGIQKQSKNKLSVVKFAITDILHTNKIRVIVDYDNQKFHTDRNWDSTVANLSFSHRFGKTTVARARQRQSGVEDEKRRASS